MPDSSISGLSVAATQINDADLIPVVQGGMTKKAAASLMRVHSLNLLTAPTAAFDFGGQRLTNLATPTASTDAATKAYCDATALGLDPKGSVLCASTANIAASLDGTGQILTASANGVLTLDGQSPAVGKRVLMKNQTTGAQNGIYTVTSAGAAGAAWVLTRTTDANSGTVLTSGAALFVETGTAQATTQWVLSTGDPITVGTTALTFVQFGGGATYTAGTGLSLVGNQFSVSYGTTAGTALQGGGSLGTPSGGTLTNCTGLPVATGISGLAANVATFLATPSSANLASAVTDETGTGGALVFANNPTLNGATLSGALGVKAVLDTITTVAPVAGVVTLDLALGQEFLVNLTGNVTSFTLSNAPSGAFSFSVSMKQDATGGRTVAWTFTGKTLLWTGGAAPTVTSTAAKEDEFAFKSRDSGATFKGYISGQNF